MAKFGKKFRNSQIEEWKKYYINYKILKQKIKSIKQKIFSRPRDGTLNIANNRGVMTSLNIIPIVNRTTSLLLDDLSILYLRKYGEDVKEFIELLDNELNRCYLFYVRIEKELYRKVNGHLYTQTNYLNYNPNEIYNELVQLNKTVYLIKCLNSYINQNMYALKNILKKFDNKLSTYCGNIQTKYICKQLTLPENNKLKTLLQCKIIDEALTICESNLNELMKYFNQSNSSHINSRKITFEFQNMENNNNIKEDKKENLINNDNIVNNNLTNNNNDNMALNGLNIKTKINEKKDEILKYMKEIDEFTYFKIQYGDWFYYIKEENDKLTKHNQKLLENDIFNPILSASYKDDNIIMKFLSKKKEIKEAQVKMSLLNKINITFIIIHSFFYNTLVTCIYPSLFIYIKHKNYNHIYSFLTIVFTYLSSFFFMIIYHNTDINNIKITNNISYILLFIGSLGYSLSLSIKNLKDTEEYIIFLYILGSRISIGLGNNIMMGKKYITLYSPRFYVAKISLYFLIFQILGLAFGPLFGEILLYIPESEDLLFLKIEYNRYNCIGWYGCIFSFILFIFNCILFTRPDSSYFFIVKNENQENNMNNNNFEDDIEDTQDKEFYKMQKEMINNKQNYLNNSIDNNASGLDESLNVKEDSDEIKQFNISKRLSNILSQKNLTIYNELGKTKKVKKRTSSLSKKDLDEIIVEGNEEIIDINYNNNPNPFMLQIQKEMEEIDNIENNTNNDFNRINMIPRAINDIIRKEKVSFGYVNHNLLILFLLLFFNNMIKENYIAFFSYYITEKEGFSKYGNNMSEYKLLCFLTGSVYLIELISLFFIFPFHKINYLFKKYLIILMILTNILMISLSIFIYCDNDDNEDASNIIFLYITIISLLILINMIIEIISSSYLTYLLPPGWKFSNIRAGALTVYIMNLGKITGVLFCLVSFNETKWNYFGITIIVFLAYTCISIYLYKSPNVRIKSICRIMQYKKLTEFIF